MDEATLNAVFQAYNSGAMSPEERTEYEADVAAGTMQTPAGVTLPISGRGVDTPVSSGAEVDPGVLEAYTSGAMTRDDKIQFEEDVNAGLVQLPPEAQIEKTEPMGFFEGVGEQITGVERTTPEIEALPEWTQLPEMNEASMASFKSAIGTMITNPKESVQILTANYPEMGVRYDAKGNFILKSSIDGNEYAIHPGFQWSDVPRAGAAMAAFTPAGATRTLVGQTVGAMGTQAAIEGSQVATGGEFDAEQISLAGMMGAGGHLVSKGLGRAYERFAKGKPGAVSRTTPDPSRVSSMASPKSAEELATTAKAAAEGGVGAGAAKETLAREAMPDEKVIEAARRLDIEEYLQPDHVSTNQAFRELAQAVKSIPGSQARTQEVQGLEQVAQRADNLITELGGTKDLSRLDVTVKSRLNAIQSELDSTVIKLFKRVNKIIPPKTEAPASNLLGFLEKKADEMGGVEFLTTVEQGLIKKLSPKKGAPPTYARLDSIRKDLTAARVKNEGDFKDLRSGVVKQLERELLKDQQVIAEQQGVLEIFNTARQTTAIRKGVEDDLTALFGRNLQGTIIGDLSKATKKLAAGDVSNFIQMLKSVPEDMRKEVVASGLNTAFGVTAKNGQLSFTNYAKWYEGLLKNKQAHAALMTNLPKEARKQLSDLYRVSNGIRKATKERITTGRIQSVREELKGADGLMGSIYDVVKRSGVGVAAEAVTTPLGMPGAGVAAGISSALTRGKPNALKAADKLMTSPEFISMAKTGSEESARKLAATPLWRQFVKSLGSPKELSAAEQWILSAFQADRSANNE